MWTGARDLKCLGCLLALPGSDYNLMEFTMAYEAPKTTVIGTIADLTRADFLQAGNDGQWPHLLFGDGGS